MKIYSWRRASVLVGSLIQWTAIAAFIATALTARASDITVSGTYTSNSTITSSGAITTNGSVVIPSGVTVTFTAATQVNLLSGFNADIGCSFTAQSTGPSLRPADPTAWAAREISSTGFTGQWSPVSSATGYRLDVASDPGFTAFLAGYQDLYVTGTTNSAILCPTSGHTYYYRVRSVNASGVSYSSNVVAVTPGGPVIQAPIIVLQPQAQGIILGTAAFFTVTVDGSSPLFYQWWKDGAAIPGARSSVFVLANVKTSDLGAYSVVISNGAGSVTSQSATLSLSVVPPVISTQPTSQTAAAGTGVVFSVTASGAAPLTYQWQKNGASIAGATSATLSIPQIQASDAGMYCVVVSNGVGSTTSAGATLTVIVAASIGTQPSSQTVNAGASVTFSVVASGSAPLNYQWQKNGANVAGATATTLSLSNVQPADVGSYHVVVTNAAGSVTSSDASLAVNVPPTITTQPQSQMVSAGASMSFSVIAAGTPPLSYQWRKNGTAISGAIGSTLTITNVQNADLASYSVVVSNGVANIVSNDAILAFAPVAPVFVTQPQGQTVLLAGSVTFSATATGLPIPTYQWFKNGASIAGATSSSLTLSNLQLSDAGSYSVQAINSVSSVASTIATLTVNKNPQTISFAAPSNHNIGDASFTLTATASSGLSVTFSIASGPATLSGNTLTLGSIPGTVVVRAMQAGNSVFAPAPTVTQTFLLNNGASASAGDGGVLPTNWPNTPGTDTHLVGSTAASMQVDKSGALTASIAFWVSPGTAGMQPSLSLNYSSHAGSGIAGYGWSLGGLSAITRGKKTLATDGVIHGVDFSFDDQYYLDGQRLILIKGTHGQDGAEYRTEIETFIRVIANGSAGNGPAWFKVWTKDGRILEYGNTSDSQLKANSSTHTAEVQTWMANKILDVSGNYMICTYANDFGAGEQRLTRIDYTGHEGTPKTETYASVRLEYEARPDTSFSYLHGAKFSSNHRLKTVTAYYGESAVRTYVLEYIKRSDNNRSMLVKLTESGKDGASYNPLVFDYTNPPNGWDVSTIDDMGTLPGGIDLDGDGRPDIMGNGLVQAKLNLPSGFKTSPGYCGPTIYGDINGDGLIDGMDLNGNCYMNNGDGFDGSSAWSLPSMPPGLANWVNHSGSGNTFEKYERKSGQLIDINNDGRLDLVIMGTATVWAADAQVDSEGNPLNSGGGPQEQPWPIYEIWMNTGAGWALYGGIYNGGSFDLSTVHFTDINGDGLADTVTSRLYVAGLATSVALGTTANSNGFRPATATELSALGPPEPFDLTGNLNISSFTAAELLDLNGDGLPDIIRHNSWGGGNPASFSANTAWFNTGDGWVPAPDTYKSPFLFDAHGPLISTVDFVDVNNDGILDLVHSEDDIIAGTGDRTVLLGTGSGWSNTASTSCALPLPLKLRDAYGYFRTGAQFIDVNGDGAVDMVCYSDCPDDPNCHRTLALNRRVNPDRLISVTTGFGVQTKITYAPLTERDNKDGFTVYSREAVPAGDTYTDIKSIIGPLYVVKAIDYDNGIGGRYSVDYHYGGLRTSRIYGSLGFAWTSAHDSRSDLASVTTYWQSAYSDTRLLNGFVSEVVVTTNGGTGNIISDVQYDWTLLLCNGGKTGHPYSQLTQTTTRDPDGTPISYKMVWPQDIDDFGNPGTVNYAILPSANDEDHEIDTGTTTKYKNIVDAAHWIIGQAQIQQTYAIVPGAQPLQRTSTYLYYDNGSLKEEVSEPVINASTGAQSDGVNTIHTSHVYDNFGNLQTTSISGSDVDSTGRSVDAQGNPITSSRSSSTSYDSIGRFPDHSLKAPNYREDYTYDQSLGEMLSLKGPNGLTTSWNYDGFGMRKGETRPDTTTTTKRWCWAGASAPTLASYFIETSADGQAPSLMYYDSSGRGIRSVSLDGNGATIYADTSYDNMGRVSTASVPYRSGTPFVKTTTYDLLGRTKTVSAPDDQAATGYATTSLSYSGLVTEITDPKNHVSHVERNVAGWVVKSIRNAGAAAGAVDRSEVRYGYDSFGNVLTTTADGVVTVVTYDIYRRKKTMIDSNMGGSEHPWTYSYNAFGDIVSQVDPKGQTVSMVYDALGRLVQRTESEGVTTWSYDTAIHDGGPSDRPGVWMGLLGAVSAPGDYSESYSYDGYGRPFTVARKIDGVAYTNSLLYDSYGRIERTIYPTGFQTRNVYNAYGYVKEVRRADGASNDLFWHADSYSDDGRISGETYGNGVTGDFIYSPASGRLVGTGVGLGTGNTVQFLAYMYDPVGNVTCRTDSAIGRDERFSFAGGSDGYDGLERLRVHRITGGATVTVKYDATGNITNKSDVGDYVYDFTPTGRSTAMPHAVHTAGTGTYTYDLNGNMLTGAGRTLHWTSYDQLQHASDDSGHYSDFTFGANHERIKQVANAGTTVYVGQLWEKFTGAGTSEERNYVFAPTGRIAVVKFGTSALGAVVNFFHTDGLGSATAVTDGSGSVVKRFAFDAWGKRIDPITGTAISSATNGSFTRGFTDHEELDDLGLVHMNGRVYDPIVGRFLSADPFVNGSYDGQGFNRYSYVSNNPLKTTDPTGYTWQEDVAYYMSIGDSMMYVSILEEHGYEPWGYDAAVAAEGDSGGAAAGSLLNRDAVGDNVKNGSAGLKTTGREGQLGEYYEKGKLKTATYHDNGPNGAAWYDDGYYAVWFFGHPDVAITKVGDTTAEIDLGTDRQYVDPSSGMKGQRSLYSCSVSIAWDLAIAVMGKKIATDENILTFNLCSAVATLFLGGPLDYTANVFNQFAIAVKDSHRAHTTWRHAPEELIEAGVNSGYPFGLSVRTEAGERHARMFEDAGSEQLKVYSPVWDLKTRDGRVITWYDSKTQVASDMYRAGADDKGTGMYEGLIISSQ